MEEWAAALRHGETEAAWDAFITRYRRLIFAAIRHYTHEHDEVMDVFARVCEALRENDLRRLRAYEEPSRPRARFSTWLVTVVHHLTVDWFRGRDGRRRVAAVLSELTSLQQGIFEQVFVERRSHLEAFGLLSAAANPPLSFREFQSELRATYRIVLSGRRGRIFRSFGAAPLAEPSAESEPESVEDAARRQAALEAALNGLSPEDRVAIELHFVHELPAAQIARTLGLPNAKAVYNRVYRALERLRAHFGQSGGRRPDG